MKTFKVSAPGKLHLLGEHTVVYGKPAIIAAVNKRCFVEIIPRKDKVIEIVSKNLKILVELDEARIIAKTQEAQKKWNEFSRTNNSAILKSITANALNYPTIAIGETLLYYKRPIPSGFTLIIDSQIPIGSGMGSSAALAVAITGAISLFLGHEFDKRIINNIAYLSEQKKHGFPSGGDNSASCYGGLIWFRKETPDLNLIKQLPFTLPKSIKEDFFIVDTGIPDESTGEMVSMVKTLYQQNPLLCKKIFISQELLVRNLVSTLKNGNENEIIRIIKNGEANLENLGVASTFVQTLIRKLEKTGGAAKICGAGGKKDATGIVLGFHKNPMKMQQFVLQARENFQYEKIILGADGVREKMN